MYFGGGLCVGVLEVVGSIRIWGCMNRPRARLGSAMNNKALGVSLRVP